MDTDITFISQVIEKAQIASLKVPPRGMALYRSGEATALRVVEEERFILGRGAAEAGKEKLVDLSEHEGYESGVSRRHALVRKTPEGYEIIDLGSTNGTWLGKQKLAPNRAYPIFSGAQVYLGRMCLYLIFQQADAKE
jgi:pSer/pThr/pTyr-binding forkhead associated (FHA) protein